MSVKTRNAWRIRNKMNKVTRSMRKYLNNPLMESKKANSWRLNRMVIHRGWGSGWKQGREDGKMLVKRYKYLIIILINSADLTYSIVTMINSTVLYT